MTDPKTITDLQSEWAALLEEEEAAFDRCVALEQADAATKDKSEAVRHWWGVVNRVLWMFTRTREQLDHELSPFPAFTFARLANVTEDLGKGNIPLIISDVAERQRPRWWRRERYYIAFGVLYVEAVKRGDIVDPSHNKTVRQAFNVTAKTVQNWLKQRDQLVAGVAHRHLTPNQLRDKMLEAGKIYSRVGRGAPSHN